jgi:hypothetical protein
MVTCGQDLYSTWLPFIGDSRTLSAPSRCWRFAWVKLRSPAPVLINHRDACLSCKAYDGLDEDGRILIIIHSHTNRPEDGQQLDCPDGGPRTVRVNVKRAAVSLVPLVNGGTRIAAMAHIDPLLDHFPAWLVNWVATKVCYVGVWQWNRHARRIAAGDDKGQHRQAMRANPSLYDWIADRVSGCKRTERAVRYFGGAVGEESHSP